MVLCSSFLAPEIDRAGQTSSVGLCSILVAQIIDPMTLSVALC